MMIFNAISDREPFAQLIELAALLPSTGVTQERLGQLCGPAAARIVREAEAYSLEGNLWRMALALHLCEDDNLLGRAAELGGAPSEFLTRCALDELKTLCGAVVTTQSLLRHEAAARRSSALPIAALELLTHYAPSRRSSVLLDAAARALVAGLAEKIFTAIDASRPERALEALIDFYRTHGCGVFALHRAFKWGAGEGTGAGLVPIVDLDTFTLASLVGYEEQKAELLANTEQFLSGRAANNVLLFGDSGTGKSSSVKALLNEPGFVLRGLRMIEVRKEQYREIPEILNHVRGRNHRFILFIDDLSFEEFEVEYKYLKAIIEGGLERKPDNTLIYATSNRRNLIREVWKDRKSASDDVHGWDTMQEKHSLADRFGVAIWYGTAGKELYLEMIETMAREEGLATPKDELARMALQWEVGRGGYTGRTARQFIQYARRQY